MTAVEANKAAFRRFYEDVVNRRELGAVDAVFHPDVVAHAPLPDMKPGVQGIVEALAMEHAAFPDHHLEAEDIIAEGDRVAARFTITGTHEGAFLGIAATGRAFRIEEMMIARFEDGRIAEFWSVVDVLSMMRQLRALPNPSTPLPDRS